MLADSAYSLVYANLLGRPPATAGQVAALLVCLSLIVVGLLIYCANKK
jgi:hypothetical protein